MNERLLMGRQSRGAPAGDRLLVAVALDLDRLLARLYAGEGMAGFDRFDGSWPLVGRTAVLDRFRTMLADEELIASDVPVGLAIVGPAGVGKTRLAAECQALAQALDW